jgi:hypothetical protein
MFIKKNFPIFLPFFIIYGFATGLLVALNKIINEKDYSYVATMIRALKEGIFN